ncbi:SDR family oxidoreductase [Nocardia wallacei]|uniref:SDR family oxidoreductase n=1 Tax=Nocardia wallacei TaxID=480035 RepID=UPI0024540996|nr:NAD(P)H-binding protein [Nocardia wallacei]
MIVVTGATGTVGRLVVEQLCALGARVRAVTRRPSTASLPAGVEIVRGDLGEPDGLPGVLAGADRVFLLSAGPELPRHDAAVAAAPARAGVAHIVKLSSGRAGDAAATDPIPAWHRAGERAPLGFHGQRDALGADRARPRHRVRRAPSSTGCWNTAHPSPDSGRSAR